MGKVGIIGVGQSAFVRGYPGSIRELAFEAFRDAMKDAGMGSKDKDALARDDLVAISKSAIEGIQGRGGASFGDKTLLDALGPATEALEQSDPSDLLAGLQAAADAAEEQIEATKGWEAKRGRQSFVGERSKGTVDPGIVAVAMMMQAVVKALKEKYA